MNKLVKNFIFFLMVFALGCSLQADSQLYMYSPNYQFCESLQNTLQQLLKLDGLVCSNGRLLYFGNAAQWQKMQAVIKSLDVKPQEYQGTIQTHMKSNSSTKRLGFKSENLRYSKQRINKNDALQFRVMSGYPFKFKLTATQVKELGMVLFIKESGLFVELTLNPYGKEHKADLKLTSQAYDKNTLYAATSLIIGKQQCKQALLHKQNPLSQSYQVDNKSLYKEKTTGQVLLEVELCLHE